MMSNPFYKPPIAPVQKSSKSSSKKQNNHNYMNYIADRGGCGHWRILFPEQLINLSGMGTSVSIHKMIYDHRWYDDVTAIKLQRQVSENQLKFVQFLKSIQKEKGFKMIYEVDDILFREDIPDYNGFKGSFDNDQIRQNAIDAIKLCDEMTVTCPFMRDYFKSKTGKNEISVIENFLPKSWFGNHYNQNKIKRNYEKHIKRPRIVYAGAASHFDIRKQNNGIDDFTHVTQFVIDNVDKYRFVFIGGYPQQLKVYVQSGKIEYHPWKSLHEFPSFLESLEAQAFFAPLQDNTFNKAKSNIKFLEAAALGIPCLCQDLCTYDIAPNTLKFNTAAELEEKLNVLLHPKNKKKYLQTCKTLRELSEDYFLENPQNIGKHLEAYDTKYGDPNRKYLTY